MTISKQLSPVGYLNKMTGHIWTPTEQPNAADEQLAKGKDKADVINTGFNLGAEAMISMLRMSANALRAGRKG